MTVISAAAVDYVNIASIGLIFDSTVSENTVTVAINDDTVVEADETFFGNLENPDGDPVILNPDLATVTILDADDSMCSICVIGCALCGFRHFAIPLVHLKIQYLPFR